MTALQTGRTHTGVHICRGVVAAELEDRHIVLKIASLGKQHMVYTCNAGIEQYHCQFLVDLVTVRKSLC
jgi:hypothetical protein